MACKLHHVSRDWGDARKEAFVRHVEREIDITVGVHHRRVVETFAAFEINASTFVSVMPFCNGGSLAELQPPAGAARPLRAGCTVQLPRGLSDAQLRSSVRAWGASEARVLHLAEAERAFGGFEESKEASQFENMISNYLLGGWSATWCCTSWDKPPRR